MATKIKMAANALLILGDRPIDSFEDNTAGAQAMANLYEVVYLDLVTSTPWSFCRKQRLLSKNTTPPVFDSYQYSYNLPSDFQQAIGLRSGNDYTLYEGKKLYTNDSAAELEYIIRPNEGDLPGYFVKLVEDTLAARACMAVTDNASLLAQLKDEAFSQLLKARGLDAQADTNMAIRSSPFTEVRN